MTSPLKIILLGTGTPIPDTNAYGTATLVEAGDQRVLLDCGRGAVIRMAEAGYPIGSVKSVFLSHYHSDHYAGIFDLLMTGAIPHPFGNRGAALDVYGPEGVEHITKGANQAARPDRDIRVADAEIDGNTMRMVPHVYEEGVVFEQDGLKIIAILVDHGEFIKPAYAFRVEYNGHVFVHSHDTRYNENLIAQAKGADVMVHEVAAARPETLAAHRNVKIAVDHHASPTDVGRVFTQVKPKLALLTHIALFPPNPPSLVELVEEVAQEYDGPVVVAEDLMTIIIGKTASVIPHRCGGQNRK